MPPKLRSDAAGANPSSVSGVLIDVEHCRDEQLILSHSIAEKEGPKEKHKREEEKKPLVVSKDCIICIYFCKLFIVYLHALNGVTSTHTMPPDTV